jgi:hypothetical protein
VSKEGGTHEGNVIIHYDIKAIVEYLIIALSHFDTSCKNLTRGIV